MAVFTIIFIIYLIRKKINSKITLNIVKNTDKITLNITNTLWYLTKNSIGGGNVILRISGLTNGDRVTIETHGDGLKSNLNIELDSKKNFNKDVVIAFTATSLPSGEFELSTKVTAYKGTDTLVVPLNSGKLKY